MPALFKFIELCKAPFTKLKSSDENNHVPLLPVFFNALCPLLRFESSMNGISGDEICIAVTDLIQEMARQEVEETKEAELLPED